MPNIDIFTNNIPEHGLVENPNKGDLLYGVYVNMSRTPVVTYFSKELASQNARFMTELLERTFKLDFVVVQVRELRVVSHNGNTIHVKEGDQIFYNMEGAASV